MVGLRQSPVFRLIVAGACALLVSVAVACGRDEPRRTQATRTTVRDASGRTTGDTNESAGEVVSDSISKPIKERWITDANILSLLSAMNARQIAAADVELETWHSDTVRAFA